MSLKLIIAEKPSVAKEIASIVQASFRKDGYIEGNGWIVSWCVGHLVSFAQPDAYDEKYKNRKVDDLPIFPEKWKTIINSSTKKQFDILKTLMNSEEVSEIVCATDAGREGEHIFRMVYEKTNCSKPTKRLWISSLERSAIEDGLNHLKKDEEFNSLADGAMARAKADWLVGMNLSRLFYSSVGRVQTPTLGIIVNRERDIENFKVEPFYTLQIEGNGLVAKTNRFSNKAECLELEEQLKGKQVVVRKIDKKEKKNEPPKLYDLTTLQREANRYFGLTASKTLDIAQSLYEKKLLTYPRTDSYYLTAEMESSTGELLNLFLAKKHFSFLPEVVILENVKQLIKSDDVRDHHALLPTSKLDESSYNDLNESEQQIISLVLSRLFQAVSTPEIIATTSIELGCEETLFSTQGKTILSTGHTDILGSFLNFWNKNKQPSKDVLLPDVSEGTTFIFDKSEVMEGKTSPPSYYSEDTLLSAMEHAGNELYSDNKTEKKGIGTPATRAGIIEALIEKKGYLIRSKKLILPTEKGKNLIKILPEKITSPQLTAEWEEKIQKIEEGKGGYEEFLGDIKTLICTMIAEYDNLTEEQKKSLGYGEQTQKAIGTCPRCGKSIIDGKNSYYCENFLKKTDEKPLCGFIVKKDNLYFTNKGKKLTEKMMIDFLEKGETFVKGLKPKDSNKKNYDATIQLDDIGTYVNFKMKF